MSFPIFFFLIIFLKSASSLSSRRLISSSFFLLIASSYGSMAAEKPKSIKALNSEKSFESSSFSSVVVFFLRRDFFKSADLANADRLVNERPDSKLSLLFLWYGVIYIGFFNCTTNGSVSTDGFTLIADCGLMKSTVTTSSEFFFKSTME